MQRTGGRRVDRRIRLGIGFAPALTNAQGPPPNAWGHYLWYSERKLKARDEKIGRRGEIPPYLVPTSLPTYYLFTDLPTYLSEVLLRVRVGAHASNASIKEVHR